MAQSFILASGSPRRRQLLKEAGYEFEVVSAPVREVTDAWLTVREITACNAGRKALRVARAFPEAVVLGADTLVTIDGEIIGKPADYEDAVGILRRLSGRPHEVWTAVFICDFGRGRSHSFQEISRVYFRPLTEEAIASYLARINPYDKAGAYAAQGHGAEIIERIDGSYTNVVGLPMTAVERALRLFDVTPPKHRAE